MFVSLVDINTHYAPQCRHWHARLCLDWAGHRLFGCCYGLFLSTSSALESPLQQRSGLKYPHKNIARLTTYRFVSNRYLREQIAHSVEQSVEWAYCFDVHCNAFFPLLMLLHVLQLFLIKGVMQLDAVWPLIVSLVVSQEWFVSTVAANTLWLVAISYYIYVTFRGYSGTWFGFIFDKFTTIAALPFLKHTEVFLYPILPIVLSYVLAIVFRWNVSMAVFRYYGFHDAQ